MIMKGKMLRVIQELPDDATIEDAMDRLYLLYKVERGIAQAGAGQKVSQEEARRRVEQKYVLERATALREKIKERTGLIDVNELLEESRAREDEE